MLFRSKKVRAKEIAQKLDDHSRWKTHGRPLNLKTLEEIGLRITDYSGNQELRKMIRGFHSLLTEFLNQNDIRAFILTGD